MPEAPDKPEARVRARDLGLALGHYRPGKKNAITDVLGVRVGHSTIVRGAGPLKPGKGPVRTGVTCILPSAPDALFDAPVVGGGFILNGAGEVSGLTQVMEWGLIETPILLTNTLSVGAVSDGAVKWLVDKHPGIGDEHDVIIPLVGECDDSWLNDVAGRHIKDQHVYEAIDTATDGPVAEGNVGGGTGMITCDFKGGIGTSSRKLPESSGGYTIGVLVMSNFGRMRDLRVRGLPIGEVLAESYRHHPTRRTIYGSIIAVVATDAPLAAHQLNRLAKRAALGIGRTGSYAAHGSGEIILAFSTANTLPRKTGKVVNRLRVLVDHRMDPLYEAVIEATEEAILNALCMGRDMEGANNNFCPALPLDVVREFVQKYQAVAGTMRHRWRPPRAKPRAPKSPGTPPMPAEGMPAAQPPAGGPAVAATEPKPSAPELVVVKPPPTEE